MTASAPTDWPTAFLAFSALLREPLDAAEGALVGQETPASRSFAAQLRAASRDARARLIARVVVASLVALDGGGSR